MIQTKKYLFCFLIIFTFTQMESQTTAMSYNIRYDNKNDMENWWGNRKNELVQMLDYYHPNFIGIQEGLNHQVKFIDQKIKQYTYIGVGRDNGKEKGEYTAIFYDSTKFELLTSNTFWLSETPDKVSIGWDASMERICTYGVFKNKNSNAIIYVFNAHFDHRGKESRKESAQLILKKIIELNINKKRIIVMGDFNCIPDDEPILIFKSLLDDGKIKSKKGFYGPQGTFSGFDHLLIMEKRIDYIFTKNIEVLSYRHLDDRRKNNLCISDHLPILIEIDN